MSRAAGRGRSGLVLLIDIRRSTNRAPLNGCCAAGPASQCRQAAGPPPRTHWVPTEHRGKQTCARARQAPRAGRARTLRRAGQGVARRVAPQAARELLVALHHGQRPLERHAAAAVAVHPAADVGVRHAVLGVDAVGGARERHLAVGPVGWLVGGGGWVGKGRERLGASCTHAPLPPSSPHLDGAAVDKSDVAAGGQRNAVVRARRQPGRRGSVVAKVWLPGVRLHVGLAAPQRKVAARLRGGATSGLWCGATAPGMFRSDWEGKAAARAGGGLAAGHAASNRGVRGAAAFGTHPCGGRERAPGSRGAATSTGR